MPKRKRSYSRKRKTSKRRKTSRKTRSLHLPYHPQKVPPGVQKPTWSKPNNNTNWGLVLGILATAGYLGYKGYQAYNKIQNLGSASTRQGKDGHYPGGRYNAIYDPNNQGDVAFNRVVNEDIQQAVRQFMKSKGHNPVRSSPAKRTRKQMNEASRIAWEAAFDAPPQKTKPKTEL